MNHFIATTFTFEVYVAPIEGYKFYQGMLQPDGYPVLLEKRDWGSELGQ